MARIAPERHGYADDSACKHGRVRQQHDKLCIEADRDVRVENPPGSDTNGGKGRYDWIEVGAGWRRIRVNDLVGPDIPEVPPRIVSIGTGAAIRHKYVGLRGALPRDPLPDLDGIESCGRGFAVRHLIHGGFNGEMIAMAAIGLFIGCPPPDNAGPSRTGLMTSLPNNPPLRAGELTTRIYHELRGLGLGVGPEWDQSGTGVGPE
jgi:hypothetical protein